MSVQHYIELNDVHTFKIGKSEGGTYTLEVLVNGESHEVYSIPFTQDDADSIAAFIAKQKPPYTINHRDGARGGIQTSPAPSVTYNRGGSYDEDASHG